MKPLSKESEQKIMAAIEQTCEAVDGGMGPTEALKKVATDNGLSKDFIRLVGQGYNVGAVTFQRENNDNILDKHASVDLADVESVISDMFSPKVVEPTKKEAIDASYGAAPVKAPKAKPRNIKAAAEKLDEEVVGKKPMAKRETDGNTKYRRAIRFIDRYSPVKKEAQDKYVRAQENMMQKLSFAASCFSRKPQQATLPEVAAVSLHKFGSVAGRIIDYIEVINKLPKVSPVDLTKVASVINWQADPYRAIGEAIEAAKEVVTTKAAFEKACDDLAEAKKQAMAEFLPAKAAELGIKSAGIFDTAAAIGLNQSVRNMLGPKAPADQISSAALDLTDPDQEREIRSIQARAAVNDLLMNDDILSSYEPEQVVQAYNEISEMAPRVAYRVGAMRPLLRKRLAQGYLEPFEVNELAKLNNLFGTGQNAPRQQDSMGNQ